MDKRSLTETDIRTKFIPPAIVAAGWDIHTQVYEEFAVSDGRIVVRGRMYSRQPKRRADYVLCYQLKERLQNASETEQRLTNAIIEQALN
ncbi:MAG: hypothetical protein CMI10_16200 [Oceanospirillaceae bacterium]|mgnify:CR=1 FL=1|nr:hypothetical protein [Oceanospirillaceae bacterium]|tara:strand:+ start:383 stop:652 length:270 start_codon:yes stop_codon:yes gene_type:complete